jgi:hypothetical protein
MTQQNHEYKNRQGINEKIPGQVTFKDEEISLPPSNIDNPNQTIQLPLDPRDVSQTSATPPPFIGSLSTPTQVPSLISTPVQTSSFRVSPVPPQNTQQITILPMVPPETLEINAPATSSS